METFKHNNFVNDIITGGTAKEVKRFIGIKDENQRCDLLYLRCKANISPRKRNKPTRPDLRTDDLEGLRSKSLTMRICLGLKVAMKPLHQSQLASDLAFHHSTKAEDAKGLQTQPSPAPSTPGGWWGYSVRLLL